MTDVDELVRCITALLALNERNVLVPHGVPGLARDCLKSAADALERMRDDSTALRARLAEWEAKWRDEYVNAMVERERLAEVVAALRNVTTAWDIWQKAKDSNSFTELFASICEAKALEGKDE